MNLKKQGVFKKGLIVYTSLFLFRIWRLLKILSDVLKYKVTKPHQHFSNIIIFIKLNQTSFINEIKIIS